jgi:hypothetical protein
MILHHPHPFERFADRCGIPFTGRREGGRIARTLIERRPG